MTRYAVTVFAVCLLLAADAPKGNSGAKDAEKLQGTWAVVTAEVGGHPNKDLKALLLTFEKDTFTVRRGDKVTIKGTFKLDPSRKPKAIDMTITEVAEGEEERLKGKKMRGIYEVGKDSLKWCTEDALVGKGRPKEFATKEGTKDSLLTLKKKKP